jgi:hypothetical protein
LNYGATGATDRGHVTLRSDPGGTPSPWRPKQPGRILTLKCMTCSDDFVWDYFGSRTTTLDDDSPAHSLPPAGHLTPRGRATAAPEDAWS